jgi:hypothetical protein
MSQTAVQSQLTIRLDAVEQRYCFAAWPQRTTHASWFEVLDKAVGIRVSRDSGRTVSEVEHLVAQALLRQVGASFFDRVADDYVPLWAMQAYATMRQHLSTVAALAVLPALKLAVGGAEARHWDSILGVGIRRAALLLSRTVSDIEPPVQALVLRRQAASAAKTAESWETFCFQLGLAALDDHKPGVCARFRLAWPQAMGEKAPLELESLTRNWLVDACLIATHVQKAGTVMRRLAT